jgi:NADPH:quinone reductase-like Zn-dependent oxidoreductase
VIPGWDYAGIVSEVGTSVTKVKPGDRVYGFNSMQSCAAEYVLLSSKYKHIVARIPKGLSFEEAASLPSVAHTVSCTLLRAENEVPGGLKGKTVFVSAGLGGCGSLALMLLKSVYGAGKVITTVSTKKVGHVKEMLGEGVVDQVIDYTKQDVVKEIGVGTVDFMFDTAMTCFPYIAVLKPKTGLVLSITGKSGETMKKDMPQVPWLLAKLMDAHDSMQKWRAWRYDVRYDHVWNNILDEGNAEQITKWAEEGKLKAVIGKTAKLSDLETVRAMYEIVAQRKGSVGKYVITID